MKKLLVSLVMFMLLVTAYFVSLPKIDEHAIELKNGYHINFEELANHLTQIHVAEGICESQQESFQSCFQTIKEDLEKVVSIQEIPARGYGVRQAVIVKLEEPMDFPGDFRFKKFSAVKIGAIVIKEKEFKTLLRDFSNYDTTALAPSLQELQLREIEEKL